LYRAAKTAGFIGESEARGFLTEKLGVDWTSSPTCKGSYEIAGLDDAELLKEFSQRRQQVLQAGGGEIVYSHSEGVQKIVRASRKDKSATEQLMDPALLRARAEALGFDDARLRSVAGRIAGPIEFAVPDLIAQLVAPDGLTESHASFSRFDALQAVAERVHASADRIQDIVDDLLSNGEVVEVAAPEKDDLHPSRRAPRYTTRELLGVERRLFEFARAGFGAGRGAAGDPATIERLLVERYGHLSAEQATMVKALTTSGDAVSCVVGQAGSGKTTGLREAYEIWRSAGLTVSGTSTSTGAALKLEQESGIPSQNLSRLLLSLDHPTYPGIDEIGPETVIVCDEAGMNDTRALGRLAAHVEAAGAKLVVIGDDRQLQPIGAGNPFRELIRIGRENVTELKDNWRQREEWERESLRELRHGDVGVTVVDLMDHGRVHVGEDAESTRVQLVRDALEARGRGESILIEAPTRFESEALHRLFRDALVAAGELGADSVDIGGRDFKPGERVLFRRNPTGPLRRYAVALHRGVRNGTLASVVAGGDGELVVQLDDGTTRCVPAGYIAEGHLGGGYATTIHKGQGGSVDEAFALVTDSTIREAVYPALSRGRLANHVYTTLGAQEDDEDLHHGAPDESPKLSVEAELTRRFGRSGAKTAASVGIDAAGEVSALAELDMAKLATLERDAYRAIFRQSRESGRDSVDDHPELQQRLWTIQEAKDRRRAILGAAAAAVLEDVPSLGVPPDSSSSYRDRAAWKRAAGKIIGEHEETSAGRPPPEQPAPLLAVGQQQRPALEADLTPAASPSLPNARGGGAGQAPTTAGGTGPGGLPIIVRRDKSGAEFSANLYDIFRVHELSTWKTRRLQSRAAAMADIAGDESRTQRDRTKAGHEGDLASYALQHQRDIGVLVAQNLTPDDQLRRLGVAPELLEQRKQAMG